MGSSPRRGACTIGSSSSGHHARARARPLALVARNRTPLHAVDRDLPDDLVEALVEELLANRAEPGLPCLARDQALVQKLLQVGYIISRRRETRNRLHVALAVDFPVPRADQRVQQVLFLVR